VTVGMGHSAHFHWRTAEFGRSGTQVSQKPEESQKRRCSGGAEVLSFGADSGPRRDRAPSLAIGGQAHRSHWRPTAIRNPSEQQVRAPDGVCPRVPRASRRGTGPDTSIGPTRGTRSRVPRHCVRRINHTVRIDQHEQGNDLHDSH